MESIRTNKLRYKIGDKVILDDIDLEVPRGSVYGYLGRNGAGKSTTIKLLLGLLTSNHDNIFIQDRSLKSHPTAIHSLTGNLIEAPCFYNKLTVFENLKYLDLIYGQGTERIEEVLELVDLHREKKKQASSLSMGMKQRLGIAMAIYHDPELLILDEPLNGLDPQGIFEMRKLFQSLNEQGKTIFLSSHILSELERVATHIGIIEGGKLIFQGTKRNLLKEVKRAVVLKISSAESATELLTSKDFSVSLDDSNAIRVEIASDQQLNELFKILVLNGIDIYAVESFGADLEQIFMNLISQAND